MAVDPCPALALGVDRAAHQQGVGGVETRFVEPCRQAGRRVEFSADLGSRRAFADHPGITPAAKRKLQRIDQDRLARAGFTGQHRKAAIEFDIQRADDHEVAQRQAAQHQRACRIIASDDSATLPFRKVTCISSLPNSSAACAARSRNSSSRADAGSEPGVPNVAPGCGRHAAK